jgi:hypothetical protein
VAVPADFFLGVLGGALCIHHLAALDAGAVPSP